MTTVTVKLPTNWDDSQAKEFEIEIAAEEIRWKGAGIEASATRVGDGVYGRVKTSALLTTYAGGVSLYLQEHHQVAIAVGEWVPDYYVLLPSGSRVYLCQGAAIGAGDDETYERLQDYLQRAERSHQPVYWRSGNTWYWRRRDNDSWSDVEITPRVHATGA